MEMFSFPMIMGDAKTLQEPNALLLSENMAKKLFGTDWQQADPRGKILIVNGEENFMVRGIFKDIPENSHIKFEVLLSLPTLTEEMNYDEKFYAPFPTYLLIDPKADKKKLGPKLQKIFYQSVETVFKREDNIKVKISLQPVRDTHLYSFGFTSEPEIRGSATTVQFLFIIGCFILLLLSKDFIKLVCMAGLIALPIAYLSLHRWLESYMVRIELSWWLFLLPVALVIGIALVTVSVQTVKAALAKPAHALRHE